MIERVEIENLGEALNDLKKVQFFQELELEHEEISKEKHEPMFENIEDFFNSGIFGRCVYVNDK